MNTSDDWSKSNAYGIKTLGAGGANHSEDMRIGKFAEPIKKGGNIYGNHYKQGEKWFRSTMIAMQQQADTIFLLTNDWRYQRVALSKTMDSEDWIKNTSAGRKWAENLVKAKKLYAEENKKRIAAGQPPKVLTGRWSLVHTYFPNTPGMPGPEWHYFEPKDFVEAFLLTRGKHEPSSIQLQSGLKKKKGKVDFSFNVIQFVKSNGQPSGRSSENFGKLTSLCKGDYQTIAGLEEIQDYTGKD
ncbi:hypothetical protein [Pontiella sulfatireligans]|uniref:hypothetical protein n=1 Tax=Pontiella sulfatireligans TaxID=2750658 RepID=UPI00109D5078|nr:hypothetical protein [Pontiella sulfatireligans]